MLHELDRANRDYASRFGFVFLIDAEGKAADDLLSTLRRRLSNDPKTELTIAAEQQRRIMQRRLGKLLGE